MKKLEKNYRSVELLMAVFMTPLYATERIDSDLYDKCWNAVGWFNKHVPGFLSPNPNALVRFLYERLHIKLAGRCYFSLTMKKDYQKSMNYVYENFSQEELQLIFEVYKEQTGGHSTHINYIFERI